MVRATQVFEFTVATTQYDIARAVHALADGVGVSNEHSGGQRGPVKVTHRRSVSGHVQLARRSDRYLPQTRIEYPRRRVQNRTTQAGCLAPLNRGSHRVDRELRRPVKVVPVDTV